MREDSMRAIARMDREIEMIPWSSTHMIQPASCLSRRSTAKRVCVAMALTVRALGRRFAQRSLSPFRLSSR